MLIWCLKHVKDFILTFSMSGILFRKNFTMILFTFPLGGCVDEFVDIRTNYQGYKYGYFLQYHTLTVIYVINGGEDC